MSVDCLCGILQVLSEGADQQALGAVMLLGGEMGVKDGPVQEIKSVGPVMGGGLKRGEEGD